MLVEIVDGRIQGYLTPEEFAKNNDAFQSFVFKKMKDGQLPVLELKYNDKVLKYIPEDAELPIEPPPDRKPHQKAFKEDYPMNLIHDLMGFRCDWKGTEDQRKGLEFAISDLDDRERDCVHKRYMERKVYDEIGYIYGVNRERIRQILSKALRKLKHPSRSRYYVYGLEAEFERRREEAKKLEKQRKIYKNPDKVIDQYGRSEAFYALQLSVRAWNCLARKEIGTVHDILQQIHNGTLFKIRNMGAKTQEEIISKIEQYYGEPINNILEGEIYNGY